MASKDWWCPNCKQMVSPVTSFDSPTGYAEAVAGIILLVALLAPTDLSVLLWTSPVAAVAMAVTAVGLLKDTLGRFAPKRCPICRTNRVTHQPLG